MYESHFGFHRQPFHSADASRAFFVSESIRTIMPQLLHALRSDLGIAVLTGVPGSGRTSLLRHIQQQLSNEGRVIVCSGASLGTPNELIGVLLQASRMKGGSGSTTMSNAADSVLPVSRSSVMEHMRRTAELWGPILLLIDDAQLAPLAVLNELRACTEEEWNGRDLVRCLVSAPVTFEEQLARSEYAEFGRRIRCHAFLQPLKSVESVRFLQEQIELAGGRISEVMTASALELIARAADGLPRCLSLLADETLVVAAECGEKSATEQSVRTALNHLQHLQYRWNASPHADLSESPLSHDEDPADALIGLDASSTTMIAQVASPTITRTASRATPKHISLSPGVIEFGGRSRNAVDVRPATPSPGQSVTVGLSSGVAPTPEVADCEEDAVASLVSQPIPPSAFEFGIPQAIADFVKSEQVAIRHEASAKFEVGRRFFAESSEDSISIEDVDDSDIVNLLNLDGEFDREPWDVNTFPDTTGSFVSIYASSVPVPPAEERVVAASKRTANCSFIDLGDSRMSNVMPIFDRYTWIALGREFPPGSDWMVSTPDATRFMLADYGMLAANQLATRCLQPASMRPMPSIDQIPITRTEDSILIHEILHRLPSPEKGSLGLFCNALIIDEATPAGSSLRIWHDAQLIPAPSCDGDLFPSDHDDFPIVESVVGLSADVRQFQPTGRMTGSDPVGADGACSLDEKRTPDTDIPISLVKRRSDDSTVVADSVIVALQMVPDSRSRRTASEGEVSDGTAVADGKSESTPQFSRLFTRLWENRRRATDRDEPDR